MDLNQLIDPDVLERVLGEGASITDGPTDEAKEQARELHAQYRACFLTPAGRYVLKNLRLRTIEQPAWVPGTEYSQGDGAGAAQAGFLREGQNSLYRQILAILNWKEPASWSS